MQGTSSNFTKNTNIYLIFVLAASVVTIDLQFIIRFPENSLWRIFWWCQIAKIQLPVCHQNKISALAPPVVILDTLLIIPSPKSSLLRIFWFFYIVDFDWTNEKLDVGTLLFFSFYSRKMQKKQLVRMEIISHDSTYIRGARA